MGRKHRVPKKKRGGGGILRGMRGGVQSAARAVGVGTKSDKKDKEKTPPSRRRKIVENVITLVALAVVAVLLLRRFGVIHLF
jgi:hypothetical protein